LSEKRELLVKSGYSKKAIEYYQKKVNVGQMENPIVHSSYTGPCGNTMEIFLKIESNIIRNAKFQAVGCAGTFSSGAALINLVKGRGLEEAEKVSEANIIKFLGGMPEQKIHCVTLAIRTLQEAIEKYREENQSVSRL
jgi:nitrogen fixation NifU-like protein